ncbi:hypothetical protein FFI97_005735 [Variovorax sp. KBS0712]|uniref:hypothetical protein n=1 Tax=Variovorax sp. KBS0712 TaxID=2578111 RepID=UPI00111A7C83|nr:hypothetical protein [Variovorax sp. KBS0712]TSD59045.1 hypothetical protein FFI97_001565 [Variovorax sp. KBS0712]TSD59809.1 hypothetical protein FFI97_005735 [Variovorax sp. KBS0712]
MSLSLLEPGCHADGTRSKPRLQVLEIYDRESGKDVGDPIAHLLLQREETSRLDEDDGSIFEATISLRYQRILGKSDHRRRSHAQAGSFVGVYKKLHGRVSLTSGEVYGRGGVFLNLDELDGHRIATYMMNEIVTWAKQWPEAEVKTVTLNASDAWSGNKQRRNRLYEQFNIVFDYDPHSDHGAGQSRSMHAGALTPVDTWKRNIVELPVFDYFAGLVQRHADTASDLEARNKAVQDAWSLYDEARERPIRWAVTTLVSRYWQRLTAFTFAGLLFFGLWEKLRF